MPLSAQYATRSESIFKVSFESVLSFLKDGGSSLKTIASCCKYWPNSFADFSLVEVKVELFLEDLLLALLRYHQGSTSKVLVE